SCVNLYSRQFFPVFFLYAIYLLDLFFYCYGDHRALHSFPTRRSSDLTMMLFLHLEVKPLMTLTTVLYLSCALISGHLAMMLIKLDRKSGSAGMPRPISYAVFCLKKKKGIGESDSREL